METATNMFSLLKGDGEGEVEGSTIINTPKLMQKQKKSMEKEEREQKIFMEKQKKLKEQEERERKQSELTNMFMQVLPFKFPHHQSRSSANRRQQDQNRYNGAASKKEAKDHGTEGSNISEKDHGEGSNVSEKDHGREAKQPASSDDKKSNLSRKDLGGDGAEKVDGDNKDNGAEGDNVVDSKNSKKSKKKKDNKTKRGADDKSVKSDKNEEDYRNVMTLAEYEKELEKRKALKSDEKTDEERKEETLDNALEPDQKTEERKVTPDEDFESMQLLQKESDDDGLFIKVVSKHVKSAHLASQQESQRHNGGFQRGGQRPNGHPRHESKRPSNGYRHENRRPNGGRQFINGESPVDAPQYYGERPNAGQKFNGERPDSGNGGRRCNGERPNSSQGNGGDGEKPYGRGESKGPNRDQGKRPPSFSYKRNGPVPALTLKDTTKFPDVEDTNQFPALGTARKA
ncbi:unnamed protein product [Dovyalis caffra]|uniref:Hyaluronan/mRNA-binding protein domain-containing protein n=1 Tax=Dovyalis caffra TaxID=77055 RepID=A0AAV1S1Y4_9ROSI|nr:unnamed protein product [Dovyalis caffra]